MSCGRARNFGWFRTTLALGILLSGLICAGVDLAHNHHGVAPTPRCRHEGTTQHIVALTSIDGPPCNACFFQRLLGQTLLPAQLSWINHATAVKPAGSCEIRELAAHCLSRLTRGPPLA